MGLFDKETNKHPEDYYSVRTLCPNCEHCNYANYEKGKQADGATITCGKCGRKYRHNNRTPQQLKNRQESQAIKKDAKKAIGKALFGGKHRLI